MCTSSPPQSPLELPADKAEYKNASALLCSAEAFVALLERGGSWLLPIKIIKKYQLYRF
jgi:hypothetical protein